MIQLLPLAPMWVIVPFALLLLAACIVPLVSGRGGRLAWLRRTLMVVLLVGIALRPVTADEDVSKERMNANVFFVVDRTGSMNAEDYDGTSPRIEGVKSDMAAIMKATEGSRYSIISFDSGAASQLPLTIDAGAVKAWADTLQTESTAMSSGSNVDRPIGVLQREVSRAKQEDPNSHVLVYFLSDGENTDQKPSQSFAPIAENVDAGAVLGYGTPQGGPMKTKGGANDGSYIQDPAGGNGISKIDAANLERIASELGVQYLHREKPGGDLSKTLDGINLEKVPFNEEQAVESFEDWYWVLAIALALCAVWELVETTLRLPKHIDRSDIPRLMREHR